MSNNPFDGISVAIPSGILARAMMDISISMIASMVMDDVVKRCPAIRLISREEFNIYAVDTTIEFSGKMDRLEDILEANKHLPPVLLMKMGGDEVKKIVKELGDVCINSYYQNHPGDRPARTA